MTSEFYDCPDCGRAIPQGMACHQCNDADIDVPVDYSRYNYNHPEFEDDQIYQDYGRTYQDILKEEAERNI